MGLTTNSQVTVVFRDKGLSNIHGSAARGDGEGFLGEGFPLIAVLLL